MLIASSFDCKTNTVTGQIKASGAAFDNAIQGYRMTADLIAAQHGCTVTDKSWTAKAGYWHDCHGNPTGPCEGRHNLKFIFSSADAAKEFHNEIKN